MGQSYDENKQTNSCKKMKMLTARRWADEAEQMIKSEADR